VHKTVRRALFQRFPYSLYFVVEQRQVVILTIVHQSRDPQVWRSRVSE
jgi:plasmid stabilization system protein ParE